MARLSRWIAMLASLLAVATAQAQKDDVTFFVIGKHASFEQDSAGDLRLVDYSFFSEIFLTQEGDAFNAKLTLPTGETVPFKDQRRIESGKKDNLLLVAGKRRYPALQELQTSYPDGMYRVSFETPSGSIDAAPLIFTGNALPEAPRIVLSQDGRPVSGEVDALVDLEVHWSQFEEGGPNPGGVLDDLVFVILTAGDGTRVAHSGRPFEGKSYLTFAAEVFVIPAGTMQAGSDYQLSVEHAILDDTRIYAEVPAMTTRAVTTAMNIVAE